MEETTAETTSKRPRDEQDEQAADDELAARVRDGPDHEPDEAMGLWFVAGVVDGQSGAGKIYRHETTGQILDTDKVEAAKAAERDSWSEFQVVSEVPKTTALADPEGVIVRTRWLYTIKSDGRHKARLIATQVAYTSSEPGTFAATPSVASQRLLLQRAADLNWETSLSDVKAAFLHARIPENEHVYLLPPEGEAPPGVCWRARRAVYGLRRSPHHWQEHLAAVLLGLDWERLQVDSALFRHQRTGALLLVHADDILLAADGKDHDHLYKEIAGVICLKPAEKIGTEWAIFPGKLWSRAPDGFDIKVPRHYYEGLQAEMGLDKCKGISNPSWQQADRWEYAENHCPTFKQRPTSGSSASRFGCAPNAPT